MEGSEAGSEGGGVKKNPLPKPFHIITLIVLFVENDLSSPLHILYSATVWESKCSLTDIFTKSPNALTGRGISSLTEVKVGQSLFLRNFGLRIIGLVKLLRMHVYICLHSTNKPYFISVGNKQT